MKKLSILLILTLAFASCKTDKKENSEPTKMENVMAIHDEVMPKMGKINSLIQELHTKADTTATGIKYQEAEAKLQEAHKSMMDWMKEFGEKFTPDEILKGQELTKEKKKLLDEEEVKINEVKNKINESISNAETLLNTKN
ncbi:hypothetical protein [Abyssalbus ytuae]|uniref:Viral A-type inclusion protein n=1 Tax=Abyssalbus ytuae TaxID=2926907 RepID=A0A9E6ZP95_9FLAO|nr:hypothetical protein [Abyssalbus ytuae]UOB16233.1 hypothetical protein MQE35_10845 [Abyssalbus ytuae]